MSTHTDMNVHDVDPERVILVVKQYSAPAAFGTLEIAWDGGSISLFANGEDAAARLRYALATALDESVTRVV